MGRLPRDQRVADGERRIDGPTSTAEAAAAPAGPHDAAQFATPASPMLAREFRLKETAARSAATQRGRKDRQQKVAVPEARSEVESKQPRQPQSSNGPVKRTNKRVGPLQVRARAAR